MTRKVFVAMLVNLTFCSPMVVVGGCGGVVGGGGNGGVEDGFVGWLWMERVCVCFQWREREEIVVCEDLNPEWEPDPFLPFLKVPNLANLR